MTFEEMIIQRGRSQGVPEAVIRDGLNKAKADFPGFFTMEIPPEKVALAELIWDGCHKFCQNPLARALIQEEQNRMHGKN